MSGWRLQSTAGWAWCVRVVPLPLRASVITVTGLACAGSSYPTRFFCSGASRPGTTWLARRSLCLLCVGAAAAGRVAAVCDGLICGVGGWGGKILGTSVCRPQSTVYSGVRVVCGVCREKTSEMSARGGCTVCMCNTYVNTRGGTSTRARTRTRAHRPARGAARRHTPKLRGVS